MALAENLDWGRFKRKEPPRRDVRAALKTGCSWHPGAVADRLYLPVAPNAISDATKRSDAATLAVARRVAVSELRPNEVSTRGIGRLKVWLGVEL